MNNNEKMWVVYKYPITVTDQQIIRMPIGAKILDVQVQRGIPCIWAVVDKLAPCEDRLIKVIPTGQEYPADSFGRYMGTFQITNLNLVFHAFDNGPMDELQKVLYERD